MNDIRITPVSAFKDNYVWVVSRGANAVVVDPGDTRPVAAHLRAEGLQLSAILNTHHHLDHVGGNAELVAECAAPVYGPDDARIPALTQRVGEGQRIAIAPLGIEFSVLEIPGHTRTHIAYYGADMLFCGDTLFACGCGRLFEGTPRQMHDSLAKLARLPDATRVYCGHEYTLSNIRFAKLVDAENPLLAEWEREAAAQRARNEPTVPSTIGREKAANPFLRCSEQAIVRSASKHAGHTLADAVEVLAEIREWKNSL